MPGQFSNQEVSVKPNRSRRDMFGNRKAFVTVYMVFAMLVLIPMVGLAIDFSVLRLGDVLVRAERAGEINHPDVPIR